MPNLRNMFRRTASGLLLVVTAVSAAKTQPGAFPRLVDGGQPIPAFIAAEGRGNRPGDRALAEWALSAWAHASGNTLSFKLVEEKKARVRLYWVTEADGLYGEMRPIIVDGRPGAAVFVRPEIAGLGDDIEERAQSDSLFRDTIVYLTCLHELGHALGLDHTSHYADIMFFFGYGGNIPNYFGRYRAKLTQRNDISANSGLSDFDITRLRRLYGASKAAPAQAPQK
jgi:hypothetical protein